MASDLPQGAELSALPPAGDVPSPLDPGSYLNRELSWLEFNQRVLDEAGEVVVAPVSGGRRSRARVPRHRAA